MWFGPLPTLFPAQTVAATRFESRGVGWGGAEVNEGKQNQNTDVPHVLPAFFNKIGFFVG